MRKGGTYKKKKQKNPNKQTNKQTNKKPPQKQQPPPPQKKNPIKTKKNKYPHYSRMTVLNVYGKMSVHYLDLFYFFMYLASQDVNPNIERTKMNP